MKKKAKIIGVTGGLATGKTTVAGLFVSRGAALIDADEIAHDIMEKDREIRNMVIKVFGEGILSGGRVDRRKLARKVFFDRAELGKLCDIMHPAIIGRIKRELDASGEDVVVMDAPLLLESGLRDEVDILVVVTAGLETQLKRAAERGMGEEEARNIIASQIPLSRKAELADHVIDNDGKIEKIKEGVDRIWQRI